ncbi:glucan 1,3-beta-glucosidase [Sporothrix schenckii 1099-18]|uniref:Glucan 1,3-beta-glucosidase n=1 Tax=Sporothrix schenckii 1099-18 TaxID=1397361 RepID=A0A0F2M0Q0_SPOSC|nr:glucan 1,3-beta-glucosidase [Sporothrix schenckii 1099-18]KJR83277.1 glucan 1,3-beta-glucosidase [Sporothrix schenckii 1099-18]
MKTASPSLAWLALLGYLVAAIQAAFWMEEVSHNGLAPYAEDGYVVFRNVLDYGAKGDGVTDDSAAINAAIADGNRCGKGCQSSTITPAVIYFPAGTYVLSTSILPAYMTQLIGDATNLPTLKAASNFVGLGLIDGDPYYSGPDPNWLSTNLFYRQIRNFVLDTTAIDATKLAYGIHWPTAQATSLQNVRFVMPRTKGVAHIGLFIESGSGGFMTDLSFDGGAIGASLGNQQFTMRNLAFDSCVTAINQLWDWGWTYYGLDIKNCDVGLNVSSGGKSAQSVGSITVFDSVFTSVSVAIVSAYVPNTSQPETAGSIILENIVANQVPVIVQTPDGNLLTGGVAVTVAAWGQGHQYIPDGPTPLQGGFNGNPRPTSLLASGNPVASAAGVPGSYYARAKPQYENLLACNFFSARAAGAKGDGVTDDTAVLQELIDSATLTGNVVYLDYGLYVVTKTLTVPPGARIVGEAYPVILAGGDSFFKSDSNPRPLLQVGAYSGEQGTVELSDFVLATQGSQAGAILIQWNLDASASSDLGGIWDVHTRIGGFMGSELQVAGCLKNPQSSTVNSNCIGAFMSMHVTKSAAAVYAENVWLWTADHDMDDWNNTQISIYSGRGLYVESSSGPVWLVGTGSEHHTLYQYQVADARDVFMGQIQSETPYFQPNPVATTPFEANATYNDPDFSACDASDTTCALAWGLRVLDSDTVLVYGAGLYSFFSNYGQTCIPGRSCQARITSIEGSSPAVNIYNLNTIGVASMLDRDGASLASAADNKNVYPDTIALFQS